MREEVFACDDYSTADWNSQTTTAAAGPLEDGDDLPGTFINSYFCCKHLQENETV